MEELFLSIAESVLYKTFKCFGQHLGSTSSRANKVFSPQPYNAIKRSSRYTQYQVQRAAVFLITRANKHSLLPHFSSFKMFIRRWLWLYIRTVKSIFGSTIYKPKFNSILYFINLIRSSSEMLLQTNVSWKIKFFRHTRHIDTNLIIRGYSAWAKWGYHLEIWSYKPKRGECCRRVQPK